MPAGLTIWNDGGTVQITDSLVNPVLIQKGTITTVTNTQAGAPSAASMASFSYTRPNSSTYPMLAIRPSGLTGLTGIGFVENGTPTSLTWVWDFLSTQAVGTTIDYWLFDLKPTPTSSKLFEIYDTAGNLAFSLAEKPMRIRSVLTGTLSGPGTTTTTYDTGRTYASLLTRWTERLLYRALPNNTQQFLLGVAGATNGVQVGSFLLVATPGDSTPTLFGDYQVVVMDVTNY
jgi:hypothetical protein